MASQRDWYWRGWQIHYLFQQPENLVANSLLLRPLFYFACRSSTIKSITKLAYFDQSNVDDELVEMFARTAQEPGSDKAFLALVHYAGGSNFAPPIAQLVKKITSPILFIWGKEDRLVPFDQDYSITQVNATNQTDCSRKNGTLSP